MAQIWAKRFYNSIEWKKVAKFIRIKQHHLCRCGKPIDLIHHKIWLTPQNITDPMIALNEENLIGVCYWCHAIEHKLVVINVVDGLMFTEDGDLIKLES